MPTNLEVIFGTLCTATEAIDPRVLSSVRYTRWRGPGYLDRAPRGGNAKPAPRHRNFQFQFRNFTTPRGMSGASDASTWTRGTLRLVVAYDPQLPRAFDTAGLGLEAYEQAHDYQDLWKALVLGNPVSGSEYHMRRLVPLSPWDIERAPTHVVFGWDFEPSIS